MAAEGYFVIEQDKPEKPENIIKGPERNARPEIRLEFTLIDFNMASWSESCAAKGAGKELTKTHRPGRRAQGQRAISETARKLFGGLDKPKIPRVSPLTSLPKANHQHTFE